MGKRIALYIIGLCMFFVLLPELAHASLDDQISALSNKISQEMTEQKKHTIAVIEFADLQGNVTDFGRFLSEELITKLFESGKFKVIERQLLNKVIAEQRLNLTGMVDPESAKKLGKLLGVDAICSGTIADLGQSLEINARLISTQTGEIVAVASTKIFKDESVLNLLSKGKGGTVSAPLAQSSEAAPSSEAKTPPTKVAELKPGTKLEFQDVYFEKAECLRVTLRSIEIKNNATIANLEIQNLQQQADNFFLSEPKIYTYIMDQDDNQYKFASSTELTEQLRTLVPIVKTRFIVQFEPLPLTTHKIDIILRIRSDRCSYNGTDAALKNIKLQ
jgi:TolB-like protein